MTILATPLLAMPLTAIAFPVIDPVLIQIGPLAIRWYALAYIAGLVLGWWMLARLISRDGLWPGNRAPMTKEHLDDFLLWATLGIVIGGRLGYVLFYNLGHYIEAPLDALAVWQGGMSFHGGLLGMVTAIVVFARRNAIPVLQMADAIAVVVPIGLFFGRIANFINAELWGRVTDVPWGVVFPNGGRSRAIRASSTRRRSRASCSFSFSNGSSRAAG